ncbi:hypothetical protein FRC12_005857 [Ceratobasidium sp. 428]|nr:hypothetical protein FRC12_005857 [Ceratobasidium sp. 428]
MERFCGSLNRVSLSSRHLFDTFNEHLLEVAQLSQIKIMYGLVDDFNLEPRHSKIATGTHNDNYLEQVFVSPKKRKVLYRLLQQRIATHLSFVLDIDAGKVRNGMLERPFEIWGKVQQVFEDGPGDTIRGHAICKENKQSTRDASYVKVCFVTIYFTL